MDRLLLAWTRNRDVESNNFCDSPALVLKSGLNKVEHNHQEWKRSILMNIMSLGGVIAATANAGLSPQGPGVCDHNKYERCANCVTSAPYVLCGIHSIKHRRTTAGKMWGASLVGVGMASCAFHASSGDIRPACRRLDFWTIAAASNLMLRAVYPNCPHAVTALSIVATPFKPFMVSFCNSTAMELKYLYRAHMNKDLKRAQVFHATTCLIGLSCFAAEEIWPKLPFMHAAWHCLSAVAVSSINHLVADVEQNELGLKAGQSKGVRATNALPVQQLQV
ncbi:hypothetical protein CEUSTIGMA_g4932.t1 [Chlamydomonas eustigma]|uniref:Post-GPI attachment to proteins factor 3 n=1 Tax=Chlamydomonas eustigma TaxID=1157962 RepID=A0A250X341_9CHLO|nr:hypothetical protein CEUSTIGMA_g4932.t1 [Chlamydomonas eustigma]|eukprot:GAX77488.1 hypothetical protein CEUSTIGMA_g4932.t1 [Chlamydomonas eustigma]